MPSRQESGPLLKRVFAKLLAPELDPGAVPSALA
jgi:hypothetical protein